MAICVVSSEGDVLTHFFVDREKVNAELYLKEYLYTILLCMVETKSVCGSKSASSDYIWNYCIHVFLIIYL